jgi:CRISPR system Cascade subunit CasE
MTALHLAQIVLDARATFEWAHDRGFAQDQDYTIHAATRRAFGTLAPQPWVVRAGNESKIVILGYGAATCDELRNAMATAEADLRDAVLDIKAKLVPVIPSNACLAFQVRVCPIARRRDKEGKPHEEDVAAGCGDRATIYQDWLTEKLAGAANIKSCALTRFQLIRAYRHARNAPVQRIRGWYTDATLSGTLEVIDRDLFRTKLAGGVGRHKSFGFGALLLRSRDSVEE